MADDGGSGQVPPGSVVRAVVSAVLTIAGTALAQAYQDLGLWSLLVGSVLGGLVFIVAIPGNTGLAAAVLRTLRRRRPTLPGWLRDLVDRFSPGPYLRRAATAVSVALALVLIVTVAGPPLVQISRAATGACAHPTEFTVVTTDEERATAQELLDAYEAADATDHGGCATSSGYVYETTPDALAGGLATGWEADPSSPSVPGRDVGVRPDVWLTTSSLSTHRVARAVPGPLLVDDGPVATSPVVLAVPGTRGVLGERGVSWEDLLRRPLGVGVVRPDPAQSATGALATAGLYGVQVDRSGRTPVDPAGRDPASIEALLSRSAAVASFPKGGESELLCRAHQETGATAAVIMSEQSMVRFDLGKPVDRCPATAGPPGPGRTLHAFYPRTPALDHRAVLFRWPGAERSPAAEAAAGFERWLHSDRSHDALQCAGLRPATGPADRPCRWTGTLPGASAPAPEVADDVVDGLVLPAQREAAPRRQTLLLTDLSGSMTTSAPEGGTRADVVTRAVTGALPELRARDGLGLRVFPGDAAARGSREAVPIGPVADPVGGVPRPSAVSGALAAARPAGNTPLYASIVEGVRSLQALGPGQAADLVVVTDGENTIGGVGPPEVLAALRDSGVRLRAVTLGDVTCAAEPFRQIVPEALGSCDDPSTGSTADALRRILAD